MSEAIPSAAARLAAGAAAGLVAGLAASFAMDRFQAWTQPSSQQRAEPATQQAADAIADAITGSPLAAAAKPVGGQAVHYGLGTVLGIGYGIAAEFAPEVTAGYGTAFAVAAWALLDEAAVPAAGLGKPPWQSSPSIQAYGFVSHIMFGLAGEAARRIAARAISPEPTLPSAA